MEQSTYRTKTMVRATVCMLFATQVNLVAAVVRVCIPLPARDVAACSAALNTGAPPGTFVCVYGGTPEGCMTQISTNASDLVRIGGEELYTANDQFKLVPYVAETYSASGQGADSEVSYYSVAVVKKSLCDSLGDGANYAALKGKASCHTGYRRTAGWTLPVGHLVATGAMPVVDREATVQQDAETVAEFFGPVCAPRTTKDGPGAGGTKWDELCNACKGDCSGNITTETYNDYPGALRCLMEGSGDVAWIKHTTPLEYARDGSKPEQWSSLAKNDLRLMCPQGGCQPVENWGGCNIARAASHAFVGRPDFGTTTEGAAAIQLLAAANDTWLAAMRDFDAEDGGNILQESAVGLRAVPTPSNFAAHYGASAVAAVKAIRSLQVTTVRICTDSPEEQAFCGQLTTIINAKNLGASFSCVEKASGAECMAAIQANQADMRAYDGNDMYVALNKHNLKAIVAEDYGIGEGLAGTEYYSVAVVHKDRCNGNPQFTDLRGKKACSTGYRRTAGWSMPLGFMINSGIMPIVRKDGEVEDDAESWASFFSGGACAPRVSGGGPTKTADGKGAKYAPLCSTCRGDCSSNVATEAYNDYSGALQCLMKGDGDVAFVKHTTVGEYAKDGTAPQDWSSLNMADLRYMCPNGGCANVNQPLTCNLARVPAHTVMVRSDYANTQTVKAALVAASKDPEVIALAFNGDSNPNDYVFKAATKELVAVNEDTRAFLGSSLGVFQGLEAMSNGGTPFATVPNVNAVSNSSGGDKGVAPGAVAGIAIGCAVAGAILATVAMILINKRKQINYSKFNPDNTSSSPTAPFKV